MARAQRSRIDDDLSQICAQKRHSAAGRRQRTGRTCGYADKSPEASHAARSITVRAGTESSIRGICFSRSRLNGSFMDGSRFRRVIQVDNFPISCGIESLQLARLQRFQCLGYCCFPFSLCCSFLYQPTHKIRLKKALPSVRWRGRVPGWTLHQCGTDDEARQQLMRN